MVLTLAAVATPAAASDSAGTQPVAPSSCSVDVAYDGAVTVVWEGETNEWTAIWRNGFVVDAQFNDDATAWIDPDPIPGTIEVHYSVSGQVGDEISDRRYCGSTGSQTGIDTERPSVPGRIRLVGPVSDTSATITFSPATDNVGVRSYNIYLNGEMHIAVPATGANPETHALPGLIPDTDYVVYVRAVDGVGNEGWRTGTLQFTTPPRTIDTERPSIPGAIRATLLADGSYQLSWAPSTDNVAVFGYLLFSGVDGSELTLVRETSTVIKVSPEITGVYLKATDTSGNTSWRTGIRQLPPVQSGGGSG